MRLYQGALHRYAGPSLYAGPRPFGSPSEEQTASAVARFEKKPPERVPLGRWSGVDRVTKTLAGAV
jgi:hypothetical protein